MSFNSFNSLLENQGNFDEQDLKNNDQRTSGNDR